MSVLIKDTQQSSEIDAKLDAWRSFLRSEGKRRDLAYSIKLKILIAVSFRQPLESLDRSKLTQHERNILNGLESLEKIAKKIIALYKAELDKYQADPGRIDIYLVGGRAKGKPLTAESDLDLLIAVQNRNQSLKMPDTIAGYEMGWHPVLEAKRIELCNAFNKLLLDLGITENILQIVSWGSDANAWAEDSNLGVLITSSDS